MGNEKKLSEQHKLVEIINNRAYYIVKIRYQQNIIANDVKFEALTVYQLTEKRKRVQQLFENFEKKCIDLKFVNENAYNANESNDIEELCDKLKAKIDERVKSMEDANKVTQAKMGLENYTVPGLQASQMQVSTLTKPTPAHEAIDIEEFDENSALWFTFRDELDAKVISKGIGQAIKPTTLKRSCRDNMCTSVVELDADNCEEASSRLDELYGNAYIQMQYWLHKLATIPSIEIPSAESIRLLIKRAENCVTNMSKIMRVNQFECVVVSTIAQRLDVQTMHIWERHRNALAVSWANADDNEPKKKLMAHIPTWQDLDDFLQSEAKIYAQSEMNAIFFESQSESRIHTPQIMYHGDEATGYAPQNTSKCIASVGTVQKHAAEVGIKISTDLLAMHIMRTRASAIQVSSLPELHIRRKMGPYYRRKVMCKMFATISQSSVV